jgi:hypothetical protein
MRTTVGGFRLSPFEHVAVVEATTSEGTRRMQAVHTLVKSTRSTLPLSSQPLIYVAIVTAFACLATFIIFGALAFGGSIGFNIFSLSRMNRTHLHSCYYVWQLYVIVFALFLDAQPVKSFVLCVGEML